MYLQMSDPVKKGAKSATVTRETSDLVEDQHLPTPADLSQGQGEGHKDTLQSTANEYVCH